MCDEELRIEDFEEGDRVLYLSNPKWYGDRGDGDAAIWKVGYIDLITKSYVGEPEEFTSFVIVDEVTEEALPEEFLPYHLKKIDK